MFQFFFPELISVSNSQSGNIKWMLDIFSLKKIANSEVRNLCHYRERWMFIRLLLVVLWDEFHSYLDLYSTLNCLMLLYIVEISCQMKRQNVADVAKLNSRDWLINDDSLALNKVPTFFWSSIMHLYESLFEKQTQLHWLK